MCMFAMSYISLYSIYLFPPTQGQIWCGRNYKWFTPTLLWVYPLICTKDIHFVWNWNCVLLKENWSSRPHPQFHLDWLRPYCCSGYKCIQQHTCIDAKVEDEVYSCVYLHQKSTFKWNYYISSNLYISVVSALVSAISLIKSCHW